MSNTWSTATTTNPSFYDFNFMRAETAGEPKKMKAKEALRQVIELSNWQGDKKDYEGFIEYVIEDNQIAADHVAFVTTVLSAHDKLSDVLDTIDVASDPILDFYR